jgi:hypothetical protein
MIKAAISWPCSASAASMARTACSSAALTRASTSSVVGKASLGLTIRGQGSLGKNWIFNGSVLVSDMV